MSIAGGVRGCGKRCGFGAGETLFIRKLTGSRVGARDSFTAVRSVAFVPCAKRRKYRH